MVATAKVAIVGAGPQGLAALKNLVELNLSSPEPLFAPTLFDARTAVGGVWAFSPDVNTLSVLKSTIANVCRWRNCYSDFPVAEAWKMDARQGDPPTYLDQAEQQMYFEKYVERFDLLRYIKFGTQVKKISRCTGEDGKWSVTTAAVDSGVEQVATFDKVIIATGQVSSPYSPELPGIENYTGTVLHSCGFKSASDFDGQRVMVVGFSNTAADTACDLVGHGKTVYLSHRRGNHIFRRIAKNMPLDLHGTRRLLKIKFAVTSIAPVLGQSLFDKFAASISNDSFKGRFQPQWRFHPAPSIVSANPIVSESLIDNLEKQAIESVQSIEQLGPGNTVRLVDGTELEIDTIVLCTGYEGNTTIDIPIEYSGDPSLPRIYQNVFHPEFPTSLAFMTLWETPTGICEVGDLMAMAIAQVFAGNYKLPPRERMEAEIDQWHAGLRALEPLGFNSRHLSSRARAVLVNEAGWRHFLNEAAGTGVNEYMGWGRQGWAFYFRERKLSNLLMDGVDSPHVYRLFPTRSGGPARWADAKHSIEVANAEVKELVSSLKGNTTSS